VSILDANMKTRPKLNAMFESMTRATDGQSTYPFVRLLLPLEDEKARGNYRIKESSLIDLVVGTNKNLGAMGIQADSKEALRIREYNNGKLNSATSGNLSDVIEDVLILRNLHEKYSGTSIGQVNEYLDSLVNSTSNQKQQIMSTLFRTLGYIEIKFIIRIILKDLKGVNKKNVLMRLHKMAIDQFDTHTDLRRLCAEVKDPETAFTPRVRFGDKFNPMLSYRSKDLHKSIDLFQDNSFVIEDKLDGERMVVHFDSSCPESTKLFSRNGLDFNEKYNYLKWLLDPLKNAIIPGVSKIILDGECLGFSLTEDKLTKFGVNRTIANMRSRKDNSGYLVSEESSWLCLMVFDIVYLEADSIPVKGSLTHLPFHQRRKILEHVFCNIENRVEVVGIQMIDGHLSKQVKWDRIFERLQEVIDNNKEGLIVKNVDSKYVLNCRQGDHWVKMKPEQSDALTETMDLIILGGYFGNGKTKSSSRINHYLVAVAENVNDAGYPSIFYPLNTVGSMKKEEYERLDELLGPHKIERNGNTTVPAHFFKQKLPSDKLPDFYYPPEKSVLLEVTGAELNESIHWASQLSIRFPLVKQIRSDKSWDQCSTLEDAQKLSKAGLRTKDVKSRKRVVKKKTAMTNKYHISSYLLNSPSDIKIDSCSDTFKPLADDNWSIYCIPFSDSNSQNQYTKTSADLMALLKKHGAKIAVISHSGSKLIVLGNPNALQRANSREFDQFRNQDTKNVVSIEWALECIELGRIKSFQYSQFLWVAGGYLNLHADNPLVKNMYDEYRSHYFQSSSLMNLRQSLDLVPENKRHHVESNSLEFLDLQPSYYYLEGVTLYFDQFESISSPEKIIPDFNHSPLKSTMLLASMYGAKVVEKFDLEEVTYIVVDSKSRIPNLKAEIALLRRLKSVFITSKFVSYEWVLKIIESKSPCPLATDNELLQ